MIICAIDPGFIESAYVLLDGDAPVQFDKVRNESLLVELGGGGPFTGGAVMVMEQIEGFGMPAGKELFETVFWAGRFCERWGTHSEWHRMPRKEVKIHICGSTKANDGNVRQALIDRYGGNSVAIGGKKCPACKGKMWTGKLRTPCEACLQSGWQFPPGPLNRMHADCWQALALGIAWREINEACPA